MGVGGIEGERDGGVEGGSSKLKDTVEEAMV